MALTDSPTLREYFELKVVQLAGELYALKELMHQKFESLGIALTQAQVALLEYKAQANEWRGQLRDQANTFVTRTEVEARFQARDIRIDGLVREIQALREYKSGTEGGQTVAQRDRQQYNWTTNLVVGIITALLGILVGIMFKR